MKYMVPCALLCAAVATVGCGVTNEHKIDGSPRRGQAPEPFGAGDITVNRDGAAVLPNTRTGVGPVTPRSSLNSTNTMPPGARYRTPTTGALPAESAQPAGPAEH